MENFMIKHLIFPFLVFLTALCFTNCSTIEISAADKNIEDANGIHHDTVYTTDSLRQFYILNDSIDNVDTVKLDSIRAVIVTHNDTIYLDSITYLVDSSAAKEFEKLVSLDSCAKEWENFRVNIPKGKTYICKDGSWSVYVDYTLNNAAVTGMAQKGPLAYQSNVTITELTLDSLKKTSNSFSDKISGNMGEFVIPKVTLQNPIVEVEAEGTFLNEVTGKWSLQKVTLQAISKLSHKDSTISRDSVNVNLLTHLEYPRVKRLYMKGYSVDAAKKQAQQEIMNALGLGTTVEHAEDLNLYGEKEGDGLLMAVSLLFLRNLDDSTALANIESFRNDLAINGVWNDSALKKDMADWAYRFYVDVKSVNISVNLSSWNIAGISSYTNYLNQFWSNKYGLGQCNSYRKNIILHNKSVAASSTEQYYICNGTNWREATTIEKDTYKWNSCKTGDIKKGNVTDSVYVCGLGNNWTYDYMQTLFQICDESSIGKVVEDSTETLYICTEEGFVQYDVDDAYVLDTRDGQIYKTAKIGTQTWMAENLNFVPTAESDQSWCYEGLGPVQSTSPCSERGRYYRWNAALNKTRSSCGYGVSCTYSNPIQGSCPVGWHIPTLEEWNTLINFVMNEYSNAVFALNSTTTWTNSSYATDIYGFSIKAYGSNPYGNTSFSNVGTHAEFWTADQISTSNSYQISFKYNNYTIESSDKDDARNIRCIKD